MASRTDELRKRLEKDPGSRLFAQLAEELRKAGDLDEAIAVCRKGLEKHPSYPSAHLTLGRALFDKGELDDARTELESVLRGAADNILASRLLGECLEGLGAVPEAIAQYKTTLLIAPGEPHVVERLANLEAGGEPSKPQVAQPPAEEPPAEPAPREAPAAAREPSEVAEQPASASPQAPPKAAPASEPSPAQAEPPSAVPAEPAVTPPATAPAAAPPAAPPRVTPSAAGRAVTRPGMTGKFQAQNIVAAALAAKKAKQETSGAPVPEEKKAPDIPTIAHKPPAASAPSPQGAAAETHEPPAPGEPEQPSARAERFPGMGDAESSLVGIQVGELSDAALPGQAAGEIISATLAEVHVEQGHTDEAMAMYRELVEREPGNQQARSRLEELESEAGAEPSAGDRQTVVRRQIAGLERMLERVRRG